MQGFFGKPVDNLFAEPLIARWIKQNVRDWEHAVVVSKNAGGSKRVTSLADTLKLNFGIITTERKRHHNGQGMMDSTLFFQSLKDQPVPTTNPGVDDENDNEEMKDQSRGRPQVNGTAMYLSLPPRPQLQAYASSPLVQTTRVESMSPPESPDRLSRISTVVTARRPSELEAGSGDEEYTDERAREIITGRLVHGHLVDDDHPSPALSAMSGSVATLPGDRQVQEGMDYPAYDPMTASFMSTVSSHNPDHALGGSHDAAATSDEEDEGLQNPELEHTITLVGHVKEKIAFIIDDIIDKSSSWIAAAEVCRKGGAKRVYCIGTHGVFGDSSLEEMENCDAIDRIVVTNSFPISSSSIRTSRKLVVIDLSYLLSEAIRRNHHGGSYFLPSSAER
ncbi:putative ribose-phosphate pyrophosphokinase [Phaeomoniella chlamydospora]|uniref:Putative ribose-phosphate pyrophosphokinase n=1 Tax=Phaeomoniella chlamydospora TaxID=158046 RepID=A0A0G2GWI3_PHACM|nr:putative ribose-phosphate pyrophosphokinase [Phaeomoniella chlamydospora]